MKFFSKTKQSGETPSSKQSHPVLLCLMLILQFSTRLIFYLLPNSGTPPHSRTPVFCGHTTLFLCSICGQQPSCRTGQHLGILVTLSKRTPDVRACSYRQAFQGSVLSAHLFLAPFSTRKEITPIVTEEFALSYNSLTASPAPEHQISRSLPTPGVNTPRTHPPCFASPRHPDLHQAVGSLRISNFSSYIKQKTFLFIPTYPPAATFPCASYTKEDGRINAISTALPTFYSLHICSVPEEAF